MVGKPKTPLRGAHREPLPSRPEVAKFKCSLNYRRGRKKTSSRLGTRTSASAPAKAREATQASAADERRGEVSDAIARERAARAVARGRGKSRTSREAHLVAHDIDAERRSH